MRPQMPDKEGRRTSTRAPTPSTRSTGWSRTSRTTTARSAIWGISYPGFYAAAGADRRPPGAQGRLAAGARGRLVPRRRLPPQRGLLPPPGVQLRRRLRPPPARADHEVERRRSTTARPTPTTSSSSSARSPTPTSCYFKGEHAFWNEVMDHGTYDDFWKARNLRPHLKDVKPAVMTVGGWFDAENLFGAAEDATRRSRRAARSRRTSWSWAPGSTAAGAGGDGRVARARPVRRQDRRVLPREDRVPVLRVPPQGQGRLGTRPRPGSSRPARTTGDSHDAWPPKPARSRVALPPRRTASSPSRPPPRPTADELRRVRQRPRAARSPTPTTIDHRMTRDLHGRRPAVRLPAARRPRPTRPSP